jgi:chromosome segregation ATPase
VLSDPAAIITACAGLLGVVGGLLVSRRGQRETAKQEAVADRVEADKTKLEETQQALDSYGLLTSVISRERDSAGERADRAEERADRAATRADKAEDALDRERKAHARDREAWEKQEEHHQAQVRSMLEGIAVIRAALVSEVAKAAADSLLVQIGEVDSNGRAAIGPGAGEVPGGPEGGAER